MAFPKPKFPSVSAVFSSLESSLAARHPRPPTPPKACVCPWCKEEAKRVRAINEDGHALVLASFEAEAGLNIEHDGPAAYQCQVCEKMMYLTP